MGWIVRLVNNDMNYCDLTGDDATCPRCGFVSKFRGASRVCTSPTATTCGPGCQLRLTLAWWGIRDDGSCGCSEYAAQMDAWGIAGCRSRLEEIVAHLREQAAVKGMPFITTAARIAVSRAIDAAAAEDTPPTG